MRGITVSTTCVVLGNSYQRHNCLPPPINRFFTKLTKVSPITKPLTLTARCHELQVYSKTRDSLQKKMSVRGWDRIHKEVHSSLCLSQVGWIPSPHGHFFLHVVSSLAVHLQLMASSSQCQRLRRGRHLRKLCEKPINWRSKTIIELALISVP